VSLTKATRRCTAGAVDPAGMPAAGRDVVREPVPPVIGVAAVGSPPRHRRPGRSAVVRDCTCCDQAPRTTRPRTRHVQPQPGPAAIGGIVDQRRPVALVIAASARRTRWWGSHHPGPGLPSEMIVSLTQDGVRVPSVMPWNADAEFSKKTPVTGIPTGCARDREGRPRIQGVVVDGLPDPPADEVCAGQRRERCSCRGRRVLGLEAVLPRDRGRRGVAGLRRKLTALYSGPWSRCGSR